MSFSWFTTNQYRRFAERQRLLARLGNVEMIATFWDAGDEESFGGSQYTRRLTIEQMAIQIQEDSWYEHGWLDACEDLDGFVESYGNTMDSDYGGVISVLPPEVYEQREQEARRAELEAAAAEFAHTHNVQPGSLALIDALHQALQEVRQDREDWNNPERRMEEWAACRYAGVGQDVYFDDLNFENGRYASRSASLHDIFRWIEENCPLLMAKWRETQLEHANAD